MTGRLCLELLGGFRVSREDGPACRLPTRKSEALLAYLALPPGRFHSRDTLATLLWGDTGEAQARQSLRQALNSIRRVLGESTESIVLAEADTVALNPAVVTVDVACLEACLADGGMEALARGVALYRGELLAGLRVDEPSFEEWRTIERERLNELVLQALARLLRHQMRAEDLEAATRSAMRLLALDPLQEAVHRVLMRLLLRQGRRAAALQQYQTCVASLQRELGAEPEEETRQLYREALRASRSTTDRPAAIAAGVGGGATVGGATAETPLIGRDAELERLRGAVARMLDDRGHVVLVTGEAGIGKSRLIQEFRRAQSAGPARVLACRCHQTEQTLPFRPWIEAVRGHEAGLGPGVAERLGAGARRQLGLLLPELAPPSETPGTPLAPALLFEPLLELLRVLAEEHPLILGIEDLHWADTMSARFLAFVGRRIDRLPVLIVASTRPEELVDAPALVAALKELRDEDALDEIALGPLSEVDSRALIRALQPAPRALRDPERVVQDIWMVSKGNPFVIVESMRHVEHDRGHAAGAYPPVARRVQELVAARLDRLTEPARHCVTVAAAIGREFPFALLVRAAGVGEREAAEAVEELVRRRILDCIGDRFDFCHDWIRLVAYEGLLPPRRALLHAAVGDALEALLHDCLDDVADQLGTHYGRASRVQKAIPYLVRFAHLAAQRYALDDAQRALAQAMAAVDGLPPSERDRWRLEVALRQAFLLSILGRQREILDLLEIRAGTAERVGDARLTSEYHFRLGLTHFFLGDRERAERAARRALDHGERAGDPEAIGKALHVLSLHAFEMGRPREGIAWATRALSLLDRRDTQAWRGLVYQDLALNHLVAGDLGVALAATAQVEAIGRKGPTPRLLAFAAYLAAWIHALRGASELAIETARRGLELSRDKIVGGLLSGALGYAWLESGDAGRAVAHLTEALDQLQGAPVRHAEIRSTALLGEAHLLAGDTVRARALAARALDLARADAMPLNVGIAERALGRIAHTEGELRAADALLAGALRTFEDCGATFEAARTHVELAAVRGVGVTRDAAREHLIAALATFEAADAPARVIAARDLARRLDLGLLDDASWRRAAVPHP